jgi:hypothetical protein
VTSFRSSHSSWSSNIRILEHLVLFSSAICASRHGSRVSCYLSPQNEPRSFSYSSSWMGYAEITWHGGAFIAEIEACGLLETSSHL